MQRQLGFSADKVSLIRLRARNAAGKTVHGSKNLTPSPRPTRLPPLQKQASTITVKGSSLETASNMSKIDKSGITEEPDKGASGQNWGIPNTLSNVKIPQNDKECARGILSPRDPNFQTIIKGSNLYNSGTTEDPERSFGLMNWTSGIQKYGNTDQHYRTRKGQHGEGGTVFSQESMGHHSEEQNLNIGGQCSSSGIGSSPQLSPLSSAGTRRRHNFVGTYGSGPVGDYYKMDNERRGHFLIFNFNVGGENVRQGAAKDTRKLKDCFSHLNFNVHPYENLSSEDTKKKLETYTKKTDHSRCDCFGVAILGHGENGNIYTQDRKIALQEIIKQINGCQSLRGKPKLIFIQCCRKRSDCYIETDALPVDNSCDWVPTIPENSDFLISFATTRGNYAFRIPDSGSPYIHKLTEILKERGDKESIVDLLTEVNAHVQEMVGQYEVSQGTVFESSLKKKLSFQRIVREYTRREFSDRRMEIIRDQYK